jgi:hypothetical protein
MFASSRDYRAREPDVVINGHGDSLLPRSAADMRFSSSVINENKSTPLDGIRGHSYRVPNVSDDIGQQISAHRVQKIVVPFELPPATTTKSDNTVLYHAVDNGDLAFTIRRRAFYAKKYRTERAPHCPIVNLATVNYILRGLQTDMGENTANWESFLRETGWPIDDASFGLVDFQKGRTQHRNISMFIQDFIRPLGVVIGSDKQGGQHQGGGAVDAPVDFVVTIIVDGICDNMLNLWRRTDIRAGDDLMLVLCGYAMYPHRIETNSMPSRTIPVEAGPMQNQFSLKGDGFGVNTKTFAPPGLHTLYVLNHWENAIVQTRFTNTPKILYELVPTTSSEIDEGYFLGDDRRNRGLWHIARSQIQTRGASCCSTLGLQTFRNDSANLEMGSSLLVQSTIAPVWKSAAAAHRVSPKRTVVHTTNHAASTVYPQTSVMAVGASLGSVLKSTSIRDLVSILSVGVEAHVTADASTKVNIPAALANVPGSIELMHMFKLQRLMLSSVKSWEQFISQVRTDERTLHSVMSAVETMMAYGAQTVQFYEKGAKFEYADIVCAQEYDDFIVWLGEKQVAGTSVPVPENIDSGFVYASWVFNFYSYCSAWVYFSEKELSIEAMAKVLNETICSSLHADSSAHDIAMHILAFGAQIMNRTFNTDMSSSDGNSDGDNKMPIEPQVVEKGHETQVVEKVQETQEVEVVEKVQETQEVEVVGDRKKNLLRINDLLHLRAQSPVTSFDFYVKNSIHEIDTSTRLEHRNQELDVLHAHKRALLAIKDKLDLYTTQYNEFGESEQWDVYVKILRMYRLILPPGEGILYGHKAIPEPVYSDGFRFLAIACRTNVMNIVAEDMHHITQLVDTIESQLNKPLAEIPTKTGTNIIGSFTATTFAHLRSHISTSTSDPAYINNTTRQTKRTAESVSDTYETAARKRVAK